MLVEIYKSGIYKVVNINKFNSKWKGFGYTRTNKPPIDETTLTAPAFDPKKDKPVTQKEALMVVADGKGLKYNNRTTIKELQELVAGGKAPEEGEK